MSRPLKEARPRQGDRGVVLFQPLQGRGVSPHLPDNVGSVGSVGSGLQEARSDGEGKAGVGWGGHLPFPREGCRHSLVWSLGQTRKQGSKRQGEGGVIHGQNFRAQDPAVCLAISDTPPHRLPPSSHEGTEGSDLRGLHPHSVERPHGCSPAICAHLLTSSASQMVDPCGGGTRPGRACSPAFRLRLRTQPNRRR